MLIANLFKTVLRGFGWLLLAGILMLVSGLIGQGFFGQRAMLVHSQQLLNHEVKAVSESLIKPLLLQSIQNRFSKEDEPFNPWQLRSISKDFVPLSELHQSTQKMPRLKAWIQKYGSRWQISQEIFLTLLHCLIIRFIVVVLFLPLLGLIGVVGFIDGLTQRHLRKRQGARESSVQYVRAREWLAPSFFGAGVLYVGLPMTLNPVMWFLMFAVLFSVLLSIAARTYKKYL